MRDIPYKYVLHHSQEPLLKMGISLTMQKSLEVLQMPLLDLYSWLQEEVEQNPFLEWDYTFPLFHTTPLENQDIADKPSLFDHLMQQAHLSFKDPLLLKIASWIIGNLEPTGFFSSSLGESPFLSYPSQWKECLQVIQQFDPPGVGAKNLQESLLLQLKCLGKSESICAKILQKDSLLLIAKDFIALQKKYHLSSEELSKALKDLSSLNPFPGHCFLQEDRPSPTVDIIVDVEEESYNLEIVQPNPAIQEVDLSCCSIEEKKICRQQQMRAHQVISSLSKRADTLYKVANYLILKQKPYLLQETDALCSINAKVLSTELGVHESTVARALANKHISCPRGTLPLKSLLSSSLGENSSSDEAQKLLKKWILEENKKAPLSDRELLEKMQGMGISCARRTITKYRKLLDIPSSRGRLKKPN